VQKWLRSPAGRFRIGSDRFYPEERPVRDVEVGAFAIDRAPVTVSEFARFVDETGYVTLAERQPEPADYPDAEQFARWAGKQLPTEAEWEYERAAGSTAPLSPGATSYARAVN
jgi:formylglycine-generating enzyme required for sulfatase activity